MRLLYHSNNFWKATSKSSCVSVSMTFVTVSFISSIVSQRQPLSFGNNQKSQAARSGGNATDPISRVLASSQGISSWTPLKPQHSNPIPNPLAINSGVLTSLLLPHLSSSLTDSLPSFNLLCHSKTHARFMQVGPKAVWSIPYVSDSFFPSLKHNFIAYRCSKCLHWVFEIHQLWRSVFSRVYSNCCCNCSFEPEIIKIG